MIVLVGFMGAGKSTIGTSLAARLGERFIDTDSLIAEREGMPIAQIFASEGEGHFRSIERDVVLDVLAREEGVVALGGGAVTNPEVRAVLQGFDTVYLSVGLDEALRRLAGDTTRPLLERSDELATIYQYRRSLYEEVATITVATDGRSVSECADEIIRALGTPVDSFDVVRVDLGPRSYDVAVGSGAVDHVGDMLPASLEPERAFVVTHASLGDVAARVEASLSARGVGVVMKTIPEGETAKSVDTAVRLWDAMAEAELHRGDVVIGVGGGVVTDVTGFVASTYNRGLPSVLVPTTLLAQVDAAIGGKTGVDLTAGKNLVGTFHQPSLVVSDIDVLRALPDEELRSGLAEVIKAGLIADPSLVDLVQEHADDIFARDAATLRDVVVRSIEIKADVVARDETEQGDRAWLNYGHTFAHAIEVIASYQGIRHGEAVAVGMMAAAYLSNELGRLPDADVERHRRVLTAVGLPVTMRLSLDQLERAWVVDKKYRRGVKFVVLDGLGRPQAGVAAPTEALLTTIERLAG